MTCVRRIIAAPANESRTSRRRQATTGVNMRSWSKSAQTSWVLTEVHEMDEFIRSLTARRSNVAIAASSGSRPRS